MLWPRRHEKPKGESAANPRRRIGDQFVGAECFLVEKDLRAQAERPVQIPVDVFGVGGNIDSQFLDQSLGHGAVRSRAFDGKCPAKTQHGSLGEVELIALGVSAEVIVIVKNQDARLGSRNFAKKVRRREPADSAAHHHQIVSLPGVNRGPGLAPKSAVAQAVCHFE
jgi:hypothetical protein